MDMSEQSELPRRRSHRLPQHNYRWTASYFVTIRSEHHEPVFDMPELRAIVEEGWQALPARFPHVELDTFIVMPDHIVIYQIKKTVCQITCHAARRSQQIGFTT